MFKNCNTPNCLNTYFLHNRNFVMLLNTLEMTSRMEEPKEGRCLCMQSQEPVNGILYGMCLPDVMYYV